MTDVDVAIIGAGPAGLATAVALVRAGVDPNGIRVVDPSGRWLDRWDRQLAAQAVERLRSGWVFHPDPEPTALRRWLTASGGAAGGVDASPDRTPPTEVFRAFVDAVVERSGLGEVVVSGAVERLDGDGPVRLALDGGDQLRAGSVVVAANPRVPIVPDWAVGVPAVRHVGDLDLDGASLVGRRILLVGGGTSAGHLAFGATNAGAHVTLVHRGAVRGQPFDVGDVWFTARGRRRFDPAWPRERRLAVIATARRGSMPPWLLRDVRTAVEAGTLDLLEHHEVQAVSSLATRARVRLWGADETGGQVAETERDVDEIWLATGWRPDATALFAADQGRIAAAWRQATIPGDGRLDLGPDLRLRDTAGPLPVHVVGALTAPTIGPLAGNLAGARVGARTVASEIADG